MSSNSDRKPPRTVEAELLPATTAGAPLRAMASLAAIWIVVRLFAWQGPANIASKPLEPAGNNAAQQIVKSWRQPDPARSSALPIESRRDGEGHSDHDNLSIARSDTGEFPVTEARAPVVPVRSLWRWQDPEEVRGFFLPAAFTPNEAASRDRVGTGPPFSHPPDLHRDTRFAAYFWIFARQNSHAEEGLPMHVGQSPANGQYGGSQAGAILSYRLLDRPLPELSVYGRFSAALNPWSQKEIALGTRLRPVRDLPIALQAEQRFDAGQGNSSGTAVLVTGGSGPDHIAEKFVLETYAQGGYILGRNESYFFGGAATLQRPIAERGAARLSLGPGAWAGGQRDIHRVDVGPRLGLALPVGPISARLAIDWRVRVAGNARPGNGAALTVSSGF